MKLYKLFTICAVCSLAMLGACSDDEVKTPLPSVNGYLMDVSYTSITFSWKGVEGATQYGYELYLSDEEDVMESGVTHDTFATFSNLEPATEYTLKVWAYAAIDSEQTTSDPRILTATTLTAMPLGKPQLQVEVEDRHVSVEWDEIAHADEYTYVLTSEGEVVEDGTVEEGELTFPVLDPGVYTLTVTAVSDSDAYLDGESSKSITITSEEIWRVTGTYTSALLSASWKVTMVAYSDNSYELVDWYSTDMSSLKFYINKFDSDYPFTLSEADYTYDDETEAFAVPVGRSGLATVYVYPYSGRCTFSGDKNGGSIVVGVKNRNASKGNASRDTFTW